MIQYVNHVRKIWLSFVMKRSFFSVRLWFFHGWGCEFQLLFKYELLYSFMSK